MIIDADMQRLQQFVAECNAFLNRHAAAPKGETHREVHVEGNHHRKEVTPAHSRGTLRRVLRFNTSPLLKLKRLRAVQNELCIIRNSHLFDERYYSAQCKNVPNEEHDLINHYVTLGYLEGKNPHPLFDTDYYLNQNPDVAHQAINPLAHYIRYGYKEGRNPHPYFNTKWYLSQLERRSETTSNPIEHYLSVGASLGLSPSPDFDTAFYTQRYPDVALHDFNPLLHYLEHGISEGRLATRAMAAFPGSKSILDASIRCLKFDADSLDVALFVTHSPDGYLKPHVMHYVTKLRENGISVILIVAVDDRFHEDHFDLSSVDGLFIRENIGFDFAAWAHIIRLHPTLLELDRLYILNDSLFGPINDAKFKSLLMSIRQNDADLIGITDSYELGWHIQSYFLVVRRKILASRVMKFFVDNIVSYHDKDDVIKEFEVKFAQAIRAAGFKCSVLFPSAEIINVTLFHWKHLLHSGFPFVKVMAIRDGFQGGDERTWQETLHAEGFDINLVNRTLLFAKIASMRSLIAMR